MKKVCFIIAMMVASLSVIAEEHLKFRGVDIAGPMDAFSAQLEKQKGWERNLDLSTPHNVWFTAFDDGFLFIVEVYGTAQTNTVYAMNQYYIQHIPDTWENTRAYFDAAVAGLTTVYGEPTSSKEEFLPPYSATEKPLEGFKAQKALLQSKFTTDKGEVLVEMICYEEDNTKFHLVINYVDNAGKALSKAEDYLIKLDNDTHDFGMVYIDGAKREAVFEFENISDRPITIQKVTCNSGYISSSYPQEPIPSKGKGRVVLTWRMKQSYNSSDEGRMQKKFSIIKYTDGEYEYSVRICMKAKTYFPRDIVYNRKIGKLSLKYHENEDVLNYMICGSRQVTFSFGYANLTEENIDVQILLHDTESGNTFTLVDMTMKPKDEYKYSDDFGFDGQKKVETSTLEFRVNGKTEAIDPVSFILWDEADKETQKAWEKSVNYKYQKQGCKSKSSYDSYDSYLMW